MSRHGLTVALSAALMISTAPAAFAQDALSLELNTATDIDNACRLSFLVRNETQNDIGSFVVETVIFTPDFQVERMTLFDFQAVPQGRPRVRQFDLSGTPCAGIGSLLINGVETCTGESVSAEACQSALSLSSRSDIKVEG